MKGFPRDVTNAMASPGVKVHGFPVRTQLVQDELMRMLTDTCVFGPMFGPSQPFRRY